MVSPLSETAVANVVNPTGPPLNLSIIVERILLSISSKPWASTFSALRANLAISISIFPLPLICAKSLTRRNKAFAIRGVPLLLPAISIAASIVIGIFKIEALRCTMLVNNSVL